MFEKINTSEKPLISVVIPAHNSARFLGAAIESVQAQSYPNLEIIVVDDGSTDQTREVLAQFPGVRAFFQTASGAGLARNFGVQQARGPLLAFLDADDLWETEKLELQFQRLQSLPDNKKTVVGCLIIQFFDECLSASEREKIVFPAEPQVAFSAPAVLLHRDFFLEVGGFGETRLGDMIDWMLRAKEQGVRQELVPEVLMRRRIHDANTTRLARDQTQDYLHLLKASLDRRRASGKL